MIAQRCCALALLLAALLGGCGQGGSGGDVTPVFAFTEAVAGPNRIAIGLVRGGTPLNDPDAQVHLRFFNLDENIPQVKAEADAIYYGQGLPMAFYVAHARLDAPGNWGVEVQTRLAGQAEPSSTRLRLEVRAESSAPNVGQPAIAARTLTVADVPDPAQLSSGGAIDPAMYQISLDQALASGRPIALLFATPGFCKTATCGPSLQVLRGLRPRYADRVHFIHVEVYQHPFVEALQRQDAAIRQARAEGRGLTEEERRAGLSEAMAAWHLPSEPWLFLIDAQGIIAARYEGGITEQEIGPALERLAAGQALP